VREEPFVTSQPVKLNRQLLRRACSAILACAIGLAVTPCAYAQTPRGPAIQNTDVAAAKELVTDERYYDAFSKLADLVPTMAPDDPDKALGQFLLARALFGLNLYQSALRAFDAVQVPADHPLYREKMRYYLQIQRQVPGDLATVERLIDAPEGTLRKDDAEEVRFLVGRYYFSIGEQSYQLAHGQCSEQCKDAFGKAIGHLTALRPAAGETYLKAKHLLGVTFVYLNQAQPALEAFKDLLRFEEQVGSPKYYKQYKDLASMSLGRLFYSIGQFETAVKYYDRVEEGTSQWLDSLFELGWTYFQLNRVDRVLGSLHTLNSPYFEDRYYPEGQVLEALILFRTCRFKETLVTVQRFLRDYKPLKKELDAQLSGQRSDAEFYDYLAALAGQKDKLSVQLRRIFNAALNDKRLQRSFGSVLLANAELEGLEKLERNTTATASAKQLTEDMGRIRAVMVSEAGGLARARLTRVREDLTEIIRQGLRIKYESMKAGRGSISSSVRKDMADTAMAVSEPREEDTEHVVWPFDGTYWKDELGGYTYDTRSRCTANEMRKDVSGASKPKGKGAAALKKAGAAGADKSAPEGKAVPAGATAAPAGSPVPAGSPDWGGDEKAPAPATTPKAPETP
jgi:tetratricopeptide (TPR) repeat protein